MKFPKIIAWIFGIVLIATIFLFAAFSNGVLFRYLTKIKDRATAEKNEEELLNGKWKVLAVAAHPDDLEYWPGGTLGKLAASGSEVHIVISMKNQRIGDLRKEEQRKAGRILGYKDITFLDYPDGSGKIYENRIKQDLGTLFQEKSPDIVFTFDTGKEGLFYHHKDHEAVGRATLAVAKKYQPKHIYFFHTKAPNMTVDITDIIDKKIEAFDAHKSQKKHFIIPYEAFGDTQLKRFLRAYGKMMGVKYAEPFRKGW